MPNVNPTPSMDDGVSKVIDLTPTKHASVPGLGKSGDGADARTPEAAKPTGACNYAPHPDNTGPTSSGGTSLPAGHGK